MTEVVPGIQRLKIPLPKADLLLGYVNVYLVQGNDGYTLIDTGWGTVEAFDSLTSQLAERGVDLKRIRRIVPTHIHPDHYGLSGKLKQLSGANVYLHRQETSLVDTRYVYMDTLLQKLAEWLHTNGVPDETLSRLQTASLGAVEFVTPAIPDVNLSGGETISLDSFSFKVLWTPGHSPGHICLYEPNHKILFAVDHILPVITPNISLQPQSRDNPLGDFLNSLNIVKQLDVNLVLPAHEHLFTDLRTRVEGIIQHHKQRNSEILETIKAGPKTAYQIATEITWMPELGGVHFKRLAVWDKRAAVSETLAHLEAMRVDRKIDKCLRDSIIYYRRT